MDVFSEERQVKGTKVSIYLDSANEHLLVTTTHSFVYRINTGVCKFERFSGINVYHLLKKKALE